MRRFLPVLWVLLAAAALHAAFWFPACAGPAVTVSFIALLQLRLVQRARHAFYGGAAAGLLFIVPHLWFLRDIFGNFALLLWVLVGMWHGWFILLLRSLHRRHALAALVVAPLLWTGLEYFRCEVWYLKFAYLTGGFLLPMDPAEHGLGWRGLMSWCGVYGCSTVFAALAAWASVRLNIQRTLLAAGAAAALAFLPQRGTSETGTSLRLAGTQLEFPGSTQLQRELDRLLTAAPDADLFVFSELSFLREMPDWLPDWCRQHRKHVLLGGVHFLNERDWENTAFIVGPEGAVVHTQVKSVPVQFFSDGLPAREQKVWTGPAGRLGVCICYDLNYRRVTDRLADGGMQLLAVPTLDKKEWGLHQHEMGARLAAIRAVENGVPVFRLTSSGISVAALPDGRVAATAPFGVEGAQMIARLPLSAGARAPLDRWLAPACTGLAGLAALWALAVGCARVRKRLRFTRTAAPPAPDRNVSAK